MKKFNWLFLFLFAFAFVACDDDDDVVLDTTPPNIMITNPAPNAVFSAGDDFQLTADITDDEGLEEVRVFVTGPDGTRISSFDEEVRDFLNDNRNYDLEQNFTLPANAATGTYTITVEAEDESSNVQVATLDMTVNADLDRAGFNANFANTAWFEEWDADNNTTLDQNEFGTTFFQTWDMDDDGTITETEWNAVAADFGLEGEAWSDWDANNDGMLTQTEVNTGLTASDWYNTWDTDNDGVITEVEYTSGIFDFWDDDNDDVLTGDEYLERYETYYVV